MEAVTAKMRRTTAISPISKNGPAIISLSRTIVLTVAKSSAKIKIKSTLSRTSSAVYKDPASATIRRLVTAEKKTSDCHEQKDRRGVVYDLLGEIHEACQPGVPARILLRPGTNVPSLRPARQCRKWRRLVITIATPRSSAARTTSSSRLEPPGCMTAFTPASASDSSPSANGKKASLAATAPTALSPAFLTARCAASTRLV